MAFDFSTLMSYLGMANTNKQSQGTDSGQSLDQVLAGLRQQAAADPENFYSTDPTKFAKYQNAATPPPVDAQKPDSSVNPATVTLPSSDSVNAARAKSGESLGKGIGSIVQMLAMAASDPETKTNVEELHPVTFDYKEPEKPGRRPGRQTGFMSTDIAKLAPDAVFQDEEGYDIVDYAKAAPALFASIVAMLKDHEEQLKEKKNG